jgi:hypothetical protein
MKRLLMVLVATMLAAPVFGQRVEVREPVMGEWANLLYAAGYELYSFDLTGMREVEYEIREYEYGVELPRSSNNKYVLGENEANRMTIGFCPTDSDSMKRIQICIFDDNAEDYIEYSRPFRLRPIAQTGKYYYETLLFDMDNVEEGFVPLVLFGSGWWDAEANGQMFCRLGDSIGLSSASLKSIPHYYVIGINVKRKTNE